MGPPEERQELLGRSAKLCAEEVDDPGAEPGEAGIVMEALGPIGEERDRGELYRRRTVAEPEPGAEGHDQLPGRGHQEVAPLGGEQGQGEGGDGQGDRALETLGGDRLGDVAPAWAAGADDDMRIGGVALAAQPATQRGVIGAAEDRPADRSQLACQNVLPRSL